MSKKPAISASSQATVNWEGMVNMLWRAANQRELSILEKWFEENLTKFNRWEELHRVVEGRGRLPGKQLYIMDLSVLVDRTLNMFQQCALVGIKANCIVGHNSKSSVSRLGEDIFPCYSAFVRQHLGYCVHFCILQYKTGINRQKLIQWAATRMIRNLKCMTYEERPRQLSGFRPKCRRLKEDQLLFEVSVK